MTTMSNTHRRIGYVMGLTIFTLSIGLLALMACYPLEASAGRVAFLIRYPMFPALTAFGGMIIYLASAVAQPND
tara:strand:+ start:10680 stop:10901 length:222 start_codon:yes stop_codon:yes gene_type:complete